MKSFTNYLSIICAIFAVTFTAKAQISSAEMENPPEVSVEMEAQIQEALGWQIDSNSQTSTRPLAATYIGSFMPNDGPFWQTNPPVLSGLEAAALIFGGNPSDYAISTNPNTVDPMTITHTAWATTWGVAGCQEVAEGYSLDLGNPGYNDPGGNNTATSAYVRDNCYGAVNYVWLLSGGGLSPFVTTWQVDIADLSVTIPTHSGETYNYSVDWGDGSPLDTGNTGDATHIYAAPGTYTVTITGLFPQIYFNYYADRQKIMSIEQWGDNPWTSMNSAFMGATNLVSNAVDIPDLSNVTDMYGMFAYTDAFNGDINMNSWDVSNVTSMYGAFGAAKAFNRDISNWDTSNVENMKLMFAHARMFNQDIGAWDVGNVFNMESMFRGALDFDQDLSAWDITSVVNMKFMFKDVTLSTSNYDALLMGWEPQARQDNVVFDGGNSQYCSGEVARYMMSAFFPSWTITDGGLDPGCLLSPDAFVTTWEVEIADLSVTIPTYSGYTYNYSVNWGDGHYSSGQMGDATHTYAAPGTYEVRVNGVFPRIYFNDGGDKLKIRSIEQWGTYPWGPSMQYAFEGCKYLVSNATDIPDFSNVTNMKGMFAYCEAFYGDANIDNWDVSNVTTMYGMFGGAFAFNADIGSWDVGNVTNMKLMFYDTVFNQDIGSWDVSSVINMDSMFREVQPFDQDISSWDVSNVLNMEEMFKLAGLSTVNYDALLIGWSSQSLQSNVDFDAGDSNYCAGAAARQSIITTYGWNIMDAGLDCSPRPADIFEADNFDTISGITLYPNPAQSELILANSSEAQLDSVSIYDVTGRLIRTIDLHGMSYEISLDVSALAKATYLVVINSKNEQISKLVIKE